MNGKGFARRAAVTFPTPLVVTAIAVLTAACSGNPEVNSKAVPTAPSVATSSALGGDVLRPAVVGFPPRADGLDFRRQLETESATGLGRPPSETYVDMEGEVVWIGELLPAIGSTAVTTTPPRNT